jgi:hypothetical protein
MTEFPLLIALAFEAARLLGSPPIADLPAVQVLTVPEMQRLCGRCIGAYRRPLVMLRADVDLGTVRGRAVLLHELVHHHQEMTGRGGPVHTCNRHRNREIEAIRVMHQFLQERDAPLFGFASVPPECAP